MKFTLTFKTPNVVESVFDTCNGGNCTSDNCPVEKENLEIQACADKFIQCDELIRIEFDTETGTAKVLPAPIWVR